MTTAPRAKEDYEPTWTHSSPYLRGNYAPVTHEDDRVPVKLAFGSIPANLRGGFYARNGPNPHFAPVDKYHWFDGDGRVNQIAFGNDGNTATFSSKWVRTAGFQLEDKLQKSWFYGIADFSSIGTMVLESLRAKLFGQPALGKVTANTSLIYHDKRLLALVENGVPHHIALQTLDTLGEFDYGGELKHAFTAHPKIDPLTGEMFSFGYSLSEQPAVQYFAVSADGKKKPSVPITLLDSRSVMMHDFAFSASYAIFLDFPYLFSLRHVMSGRPPLDFVPEAGARIGVLSRDATDDCTKWFNIKSCFAFHVANSWQSGDEVIVIACRNESFKLERLSGPKDDKQEQRGAVLFQWTLNMKTGAVDERVLVNKFGEFPVCDEQNRWGYKTRYVWYAGQVSGRFGKLIKVDLKTNESLEHVLPEGHYNDEFVFVNGNAAHLQYRGDYDDARNSTAPDDKGNLLGFVYDSAAKTSYLLILDAATMKETARIDLPHRVSHGFHGKFISREQAAGERAQ